MEPRAHHVLIGLFTVITLGGALLFTLWLGKPGADRDYAYYEVSFGSAVNGLAEGSVVQYSGIGVGDVLKLRLDPQDPRHVRALIRVYGDTPIKEDTRAALVLANITGSMNIQLYGGTPSSKRLQGDRDNPPLIKAEPSALYSLMTSSEALFVKIDQLLTSAILLLSPENTDNLGRILDNIAQTTQSLADQHNGLAQAVTRIGRASEQAEKTLLTFNHLGEHANTLLSGQGHDILDTARQAMRSLESITVRLDALTAEHEGALARGLQGVGDLAPTMRELQATLQTLHRLARRLEESPGDVLRGRDPVPEFTP